MPPKSSQKRSTSEKNGGPSSKRARFADAGVQEGASVEGDEHAFSAQVLEDLEPAGTTRRGQVKNEGYESDSSDDGEGVVESRKKSRKKDADEDDDMFGGAEDDESDGDGANKKKKGVKFMNLGDIEGQEFNTAGGGSDDEDEPEDEDDAERLKKKGMGFELSGFHMKNEMEEGKFAQDGTFVRSFDPHQVHDKWMDGLDDQAIKKARKSKKMMEEKERERERREEADGLTGRQKEALEKELLEYVKPGESVLQTLARLGAEKKKAEKSNPKLKSRTTKSMTDAPVTMDVDSEPPPPPSETSPIDRVTALASTLMSMGSLHIYEETHRTLLFSVREAGIVSSDWVPPSAAPPPESTIKYQYRWSPSYLASTSGGAQSGEIFGPFGKTELLAWRDAAYFGSSGERVELRRVGDESWNGWGIVI